MSNQSIIKSIHKAYEKYKVDKKLEDFQYVFEASISALEGIERRKMSIIRDIINDIEHARFLLPKNEQPQKVEEAFIRLKTAIEDETLA